jgi:hypothetical protein
MFKNELPVMLEDLGWWLLAIALALVIASGGVVVHISRLCGPLLHRTDSGRPAEKSMRE